MLGIHDIEQIVAEGDLVAMRCRAAGTHDGPWLGVPATGRRVELRMSVTQRVVAGQVHEDWVIVEALGVFQQMGLVPPTEELLARRTA
jgi:predicted ester cyclase